MNALKNLLAAAATLAAFTAAREVQAESLEHLDAQAVDVEVRTRELCWELSRFHRAQPGYSATYRQAWELWSVSSHIHQLLHNAANLQRVQRNTADLRNLLVGIRVDVARWEAASMICTFNLKKSLAGLDEAIEHLASDVGVPRPIVPAPPTSAPPAPLSATAASEQPAGVGPIERLFGWALSDFQAASASSRER